MEFKLNSIEWDMLLNQPPILFKVYAFLRMRMDFSTGITGAHPHIIDEASINHAIYYSGGHGRKKSPPITRSKIRWYLSCLEKLGLIERIGIFVFRLIFASLYNSVEIQYDPNTTAGTTAITTVATTKKISNKPLLGKETKKPIRPRPQPSLRQGVTLQYDPLLVSGRSGINNTCTACTFFFEFWNLYPNHKNKKKAHQTWHTRELDKQWEKIAIDLKARKWAHPYIPLPTTYLNGDRWEDEGTMVTPQILKIPRILTPEEKWQAEWFSQMRAYEEQSAWYADQRRPCPLKKYTWEEFKQKKQDEENEKMQQKVA